MDVHYLKSGTLEIQGRRFDLAKVERLGLGEAILNALGQRGSKGEGAGVLATVRVQHRDGRIWIDVDEGPFIGLSPEVVAHAPEVVGALVLDALGVPPENTSNEYLLFVEFDGRPVALLRDPKWVEMFWTSFEVVPFAEFPEFDGPWWRQDDQLEYRQATTPSGPPCSRRPSSRTLHGTWTSSRAGRASRS